jgi:hypothetical protein
MHEAAREVAPAVPALHAVSRTLEHYLHHPHVIEGMVNSMPDLALIPATAACSVEGILSSMHDLA